MFAVAQPTVDGMQSVLEFLQEAKLDNVRWACSAGTEALSLLCVDLQVVWVNLRIDPVIYVNDVRNSPCLRLL